METEGSLPRLQEPATCLYPDPNQFSPFPPHSTSWRSMLTLSSHLTLSLPSGLFPSVSPPNPCMHLSSPQYMLHAQPILFFSIWSFGDDYRSVGSSLCSFLHFSVTSPLRSSAPYSRTPSAYVPPSMCVTKFHTHRKLAKLQFWHSGIW